MGHVEGTGEKREADRNFIEKLEKSRRLPLIGEGNIKTGGIEIGL